MQQIVRLKRQGFADTDAVKRPTGTKPVQSEEERMATSLQTLERVARDRDVENATQAILKQSPHLSRDVAEREARELVQKIAGEI